MPVPAFFFFWMCALVWSLKPGFVSCGIWTFTKPLSFPGVTHRAACQVPPTGSTRILPAPFPDDHVKHKESQEWILQGSIHGSGRLSGHKGWLGVRELDIQTRSLFYLLPFSTPFSCPQAIVGWHRSHLGAFEQDFSTDTWILWRVFFFQLYHQSDLVRATTSELPRQLNQA